MPDSPGKSESAPPLVVIASSVAGLRQRCRQALFNGYSIHESADCLAGLTIWAGKIA